MIDYCLQTDYGNTNLPFSEVDFWEAPFKIALFYSRLWAILLFYFIPNVTAILRNCTCGILKDLVSCFD